MLFDEICTLLKSAGLDLKGVFLNANPGFDSADFVAACKKEEIIALVKEKPRETANCEPAVYESGTHVFNDELYTNRSVIENSYARVDGFKTLLIRFEFWVKNWMSFHFIVFSVIFLRKIKRKEKV